MQNNDYLKQIGDMTIKLNSTEQMLKDEEENKTELFNELSKLKQEQKQQNLDYLK